MQIMQIKAQKQLTKDQTQNSSSSHFDFFGHFFSFSNRFLVQIKVALEDYHNYDDFQ